MRVSAKPQFVRVSANRQRVRVSCHVALGYLTPTPFGDAVDVLLNDALDSVIARYDTLVVAHRMVSEPLETARKIEAFVAQGGHVVITASSVQDLGLPLCGVSVRIHQ